MNEVSDTCWVSKQELREMFAKEGTFYYPFLKYADFEGLL